jgi:S1-C subfamily serine protease
MSLPEFSNQIVDLVANVKEGVVSIVTTKIQADAFLRPMPLRGVGSGFVIDENGYLITNNHVVKHADRVLVILSDGRKFDAAIVSRDPSRDLALLKIEAERLLPLKLGDSDKTRIGELVLAIGSPLGLPGPNVSIGVISATGRNIESKEVILEDLIQTDAAVNPGNSGGPLINMDGEVIGVTTAMIPYAQGISFAIPINAVKRFISMIIKYGRPVHPWIGVYVTDITPSLQSYYNLPVSKGVLVVKVIYGSPAFNGGIRAGDIIVSANNRDIENARGLRREMEDSVDKGSVSLKVLKRYGYVELDIPLRLE